MYLSAKIDPINNCAQRQTSIEYHFDVRVAT